MERYKTIIPLETWDRKFIFETQIYTHVPTLKKNYYASPNILLNDNYAAL